MTGALVHFQAAGGESGLPTGESNSARHNTRKAECGWARWRCVSSLKEKRLGGAKNCRSWPCVSLQVRITLGLNKKVHSETEVSSSCPHYSRRDGTYTSRSTASTRYVRVGWSGRLRAPGSRPLCEAWRVACRGRAADDLAKGTLGIDVQFGSGDLDDLVLGGLVVGGDAAVGEESEIMRPTKSYVAAVRSLIDSQLYRAVSGVP